jgi:hypothetical protein
MAKVELDRKVAGLRSARSPRLHTATGVTAKDVAATVSKLHCNDYVAVSHQPGLVIAPVGGTNRGSDPA